VDMDPLPIPSLPVVVVGSQISARRFCSLYVAINYDKQWRRLIVTALSRRGSNYFRAVVSGDNSATATGINAQYKLRLSSRDKRSNVLMTGNLSGNVGYISGNKLRK